MSRPPLSAFAPLCGVIAAAAVLSGCAAKKTPPPPTPVVTVASPLRMNVIDWDDYAGQFVAVDSVDVRPRVSGYLVSVDFKDGDFVKAGQKLFAIDPRPYQATLDQAKGQEARAEATLVNAKAQAARGATLLAAHAISQQAYDALVAGDYDAFLNARAERIHADMLKLCQGAMPQ